MVDPVTYKKLTYDSKNIQVESAIRDGNGVKIDTNYLKKSMVWVYEEDITTASSGISLSDIPSGTIPRLVQVFIKTTVEGADYYELIQTDATLSGSGTTWSCSLNKPSDVGTWTVRIFGWADTL